MAERKALSKKTRFNVFKRDEFRCCYCGNHPPHVILEVDHIVPVASYGGNDMDNLITSCFDCNRGKGAESLEVVPLTLAQKAAREKEMEAQLAEYNSIMRQKSSRLEDETWDVAEIFIKEMRTDGIRKDWLLSIKGFVEKLGVTEVIEAMEIATSRINYSERRCFLYFCKVCWNKVTEVRDGTRS